MKYQLRIVLAPYCGKMEERFFPYDEIDLKYNADKGYVRIDDKESGKLLFLLRWIALRTWKGLRSNDH